MKPNQTQVALQVVYLACDIPVSTGILGDFSVVVWSLVIKWIMCLKLWVNRTRTNCLFWMCFYTVPYLLLSEPPIQWQSSWFQRWRRERGRAHRRAVPTHWKRQGRLVLVGRCHSQRWIGRIAYARQYGGFAWWLLRCWPSSLLAYPCRPSMSAHQNTCQNMSKHYTCSFTCFGVRETTDLDSVYIKEENKIK